MRKPVRTLRCPPMIGALLVPVALVSCSGSGRSKASSSDRPIACTFVAQLDEIAGAVRSADVRDPEKFKETLDAAVRDYVGKVRELRAVAPVELHAGLERVEADVQQYRFDAALTDRVPLDAYAARTCGRAVAGTTTTGPTATGPTAKSTTTSSP